MDLLISMFDALVQWLGHGFSGFTGFTGSGAEEASFKGPPCGSALGAWPKRTVTTSGANI